MQYLLTQAEMEEIWTKDARLRNLPGGFDHVEALKNVCQYVATQMTETGGNLTNGREPSERPHGCIHVKDHRGPEWQTRYCDRCPVRGICPQPKDFSK